MAEDRPVTPEKQLLKLIEDSKAGGRAPAGAAIKRKGLGLLSPAALIGSISGRFSFLSRAAKRKMTKGPRPRLSLGDVNRVLALTIAVLGAYLVADSAVAAMNFRKPPQFGTPKSAAGRAAESVSPFLKDSDFYLSKISARDIFREVSPPKPKKQAAVAAAPEEESVFKDLSLVGISWSANPEIIIEDKKRKKTYFLRRGQVFGDNVRVEAIFKDKIVLSHDGEEQEMR